jgi:hypothetical protein
MPSLEERVHRLECLNRRLSIALSVLTLVLVAGIMLAMSGDDDFSAVLRTKRLEVYNDSGNPVVIAASDPWNKGSLRILDENKHDCINLGIGLCEDMEDSGFVQIQGPIGRLVFTDPGTITGPENILELGANPLQYRDRGDQLEGFVRVRSSDTKACVGLCACEMKICDEVGKTFFKVYMDDKGKGRILTPKK